MKARVGVEWLPFHIDGPYGVKRLFLVHGVHELQEAALLPRFVEHVWDMNHILDERGAVETLLKALFGYNGNPSLLEVTAYGVYFAVVGIVSLRRDRTMVLAAEVGS